MKDKSTLVKYTREELTDVPDETDWEKVDTMSDEEVYQDALSDKDAQPTDKTFWETAPLPSHLMKFRSREKLKYMFLGGLLTLAGFMFGNMNSDTTAQSGYETIDKLTVQELIVRKDITVMGDGMEPQVLISWDRNGGRVITYGPKGPKGMSAASLLVAEGNGVVTAQGSKGKTGASLMVNEGGGVVSLFAPDGKARIVLGISEGDGVAYLVDKFGDARVLKP